MAYTQQTLCPKHKYFSHNSLVPHSLYPQAVLWLSDIHLVISRLLLIVVATDFSIDPLMVQIDWVLSLEVVLS